MDLDALRLFLDVAHRLSFAAAAEARGVNPSSVSRAIAQLEDALGARLLQRSTRRMTLTEDGARFAAKAQAVIDAFDEAQDALRATTSRPSGRLRLTASSAFGEIRLAPLIPEFQRLYPDISLELLFTDANLDLVAEGVDLALRLAPRIEGDVIASRLMHTRYRVCASPEYLAAAPALARPEDLSDHRCVLFTLPAYRTAWRFRDQEGVEREVPVAGDLAVSSALSLRTAVLQGAGPALLADWLISQDLAAGRLVDLFPDHEAAATEFDTAAWLVYPSRAYLPRKTRATIDFLRSRLRGAGA